MERDFRALVKLLASKARVDKRFAIARAANGTGAIYQIADAIEHSHTLYFGALWAADRLLLLLSAYPDMCDQMPYIKRGLCDLFRACLRARRFTATDTQSWLLKMCIIGAFGVLYKTHGNELCAITAEELSRLPVYHEHREMVEYEFLARDHDRLFLRNGVLAAVLFPLARLCCGRLGALLRYMEPIQTDSLASLDRGIDLTPGCQHLAGLQTAGKLQRLIFRRRTCEVAIALQYLRLPVLMTLGIIDELLENDYTMYYKWKLLKAVKHFR